MYGVCEVWARARNMVVVNTGSLEKYLPQVRRLL
jgi:hypothetical protein